MEATRPFFSRKENSDKYSGCSVPTIHSVYLSHTTMGSEKAGRGVMDLLLERSKQQERVSEITSR